MRIQIYLLQEIPCAGKEGRGSADVRLVVEGIIPLEILLAEEPGSLWEGEGLSHLRSRELR